MTAGRIIHAPIIVESLRIEKLIKHALLESIHMADPTPFADKGDDSGMPRWVKVTVIIAIALVLLLVILHLTGSSPFPSHLP